MNRENQLAITNEPIEFEKQPGEVKDFRRFSNPFRGIHKIVLHCNN